MPSRPCNRAPEVRAQLVCGSAGAARPALKGTVQEAREADSVWPAQCVRVYGACVYTTGIADGRKHAAETATEKHAHASAVREPRGGEIASHRQQRVLIDVARRRRPVSEPAGCFLSRVSFLLRALWSPGENGEASLAVRPPLLLRARASCDIGAYHLRESRVPTAWPLRWRPVRVCVCALYIRRFGDNFPRGWPWSMDRHSSPFASRVQKELKLAR